MTETLRREKKGYYLTPAILERLRIHAAQRDVPRSRVVEDALAFYFQVHDAPVRKKAQRETVTV